HRGSTRTRGDGRAPASSARASGSPRGRSAGRARSRAGRAVSRAGPRSCALAHDNRAAARVDDEGLEWPRRRAGDVLAVEVVVPVVARTPDMAEVGAVLDGAVQVRAHGGEGAELARWRPDEDRRTIAELEDLPRVRLHLVSLDRKRHA